MCRLPNPLSIHVSMAQPLRKLSMPIQTFHLPKSSRAEASGPTMDHRLRLTRRTVRALRRSPITSHRASARIQRIMQNPIKAMIINAGTIKTIQPLVLRSENWKAARTIIHIMKPRLRKDAFDHTSHTPRDR